MMYESVDHFRVRIHWFSLYAVELQEMQLKSNFNFLNFPFSRNHCVKDIRQTGNSLQLCCQQFFKTHIIISPVFGSASAPPRGEWTRTGITFAHITQDPHPFGLKCPKNATRGLTSVIQAFLIKFFIFDNRPKEKSVPLEKLLKVSSD